MDDALKKELDEQLESLKKIRDENGGLDESKMFIYSVKFVFQGVEDLEYTPSLPIAAHDNYEAHKFVYEKMWAVAELNLECKLLGCSITLEKELMKHEVDEFLAGL